MTSSAAPTRPTSRPGSGTPRPPRARSSTSAAAPAGSPCTWPGAAIGSSGSIATRSFVAAFNQRAAGLPAEAVAADAREFDLDQRFGLVLAPMQIVQLLGGPEERIRCLGCVARHLRPGGRAAVAIVEGLVPAPDESPPPLPDAREVDGWVYSSLPLVTVFDGEADRRPPAAADRLSRRGAQRGPRRGRALVALGVRARRGGAGRGPAIRSARDEIAPSDDHIGSTVVLFEEVS